MANMDKAKEAESLFKQGNKLLSPSLLDLRMKPDWEAAAPLLDKAALFFKVWSGALFCLACLKYHHLHLVTTSPYHLLQQAGQLKRAVEAYERAAQAQQKVGSPWHAAKHLEICADLSKQLANWEDVAKFYRFSADLYKEGGKSTTGGWAPNPPCEPQVPFVRLPYLTQCTCAPPPRPPLPHCPWNSTRMKARSNAHPHTHTPTQKLTQAHTLAKHALTRSHPCTCPPHLHTPSPTCH